MADESVEELLASALTLCPDSDERWPLVVELQGRGDRPTFELPSDLSEAIRRCCVERVS